jgi:hypothetical protein
MRLRIVGFCLVILVIILSGTLQGLAQSTSALKGKWNFVVNTPVGTLPLSGSFKPNGTGSIDFPTDSLPLVYQEDGTQFSFTVEVPKVSSLSGQAETWVFRGTLTTDTQLSGRLWVVLGTPGAGAALVLEGPFTGQRQ